MFQYHIENHIHYLTLLSPHALTYGISPVLAEFQWLHIYFRIEFKIMLISFKAFHSLAPLHISHLLTTKVWQLNVKSSSVPAVDKEGS